MNPPRLAVVDYGMGDIHSVAKSLEADALRDDEWVYSGQSFTEQVWMGPDGKLRTGAVDKEYLNNLW
ncbi:MAG TPA: hypothetical protein PLT11_09135, partial [Elusimicrobiota bacterium]|nr:hypothetical protein [Elusimicrobiota bacterium]